MDAVKSTPASSLEALQRKPREKSPEARKAAEEAKPKEPEQAARPSTNAQGQKLGQLLNATA